MPASKIYEELGLDSLDAVDLVLDGGPSVGGQPSTVVDLSGSEPRMLRVGAISGERIQAILVAAGTSLVGPGAS